MMETRQSGLTTEEANRARRRFCFVESFWNEILACPPEGFPTVLAKARALSPDVRGNGEDDIVRIALMTAKGKWMFSPIMAAAGRGYLNMVNDLITLAQDVGGAEFVKTMLDAKNGRGQTAQDIAYATGHHVVELCLLWYTVRTNMELQPGTSGIVINGEEPNGQPNPPAVA